MEEKLQEIIDAAKNYHLRMEEKVNNLRSKYKFYTDHNFKEEARITLLELDSIDMPTYRQGQTLKELQELLNAWNS